MSTTTEAPTAPDLSSLDKRQQLNIRVAETQGYHWEPYERPRYSLGWQVQGGDCWALYGPNGRPRLWTLSGAPHTWHDPAGGAFVALPDYAGDPAAWGALMAAVLDGWTQAERVAHRCFWIEDDGARSFGPWCADIGTAICCAVLAKAGVDPTPYID